MQLHEIQSNRRRKKRIGRGGKRGTTSGKGTKGQKSRAGAGIKPGFRGGDNRIWQLFPKRRGASSKPGNKKPHPKHKFYQLKHSKPEVVNLGVFNSFNDSEVVTPKVLFERGIVSNIEKGVKILSNGALKRKVQLEGFIFSKEAKTKISKAGGIIK